MTSHRARFYSTIRINRIARNSHKTNDRYTLYSTIYRGVAQTGFRELRVTKHQLLPLLDQHEMSDRIPAISLKTSDNACSEATHFFDDRPNYSFQLRASSLEFLESKCHIVQSSFRLNLMKTKDGDPCRVSHFFEGTNPRVGHKFEGPHPLLGYSSGTDNPVCAGLFPVFVSNGRRSSN
jgi:hypothetical protein